MAIYIPQIIDNLVSESTKDGLSANQGRVLKNEHGNLNDLMTQEKGNFVLAINELKEKENEIVNQIDNINGEVI